MATHPPVAALEALVDRLAQLPPVEAPFLSLYLDARPNQHGQHQIQPFLSKELRSRRRALELSHDHRVSYDRDAERIQRWIDESLPRSANGAAVFACSAAGVFETAAVDPPIESHRLHVGRRPHLYPLMHILDRYRRYVAVVADTVYARIYVFGLNTRLEAHEIKGEDPEAFAGFSNSELRYQRQLEKWYAHNAKEVSQALERIVREERLDTILLAGDEVVLPVLQAELHPSVRSKVVDVMRLDIRTPEAEVLRKSLEAFLRHDAKTDAEKVKQVVNEFRAGGLGVVGVRPTRRALLMGQVDELLLSADPSALSADDAEADEEFRETGEDLRTVTAEELANRARQTDARVTFIEDADLLRAFGGVAARLRFRIVPPGGRNPVPVE
jgi:peptide subunit release factor 1 (eRF1)